MPQFDLSEAKALVLAERVRQQEVELWTSNHDDGHKDGQLEVAAHCYRHHALSQLYENIAQPAGMRLNGGLAPTMWPWQASSWKPTTPQRDLVKAGALMLAEVERLTRAGGYQGHLNSKVVHIYEELQKVLDMEASRG